MASLLKCGDKEEPMNHHLKLVLAGSIALTIQGCAMIPPIPWPNEVGFDHKGLYYSYYEPLGGTVKFANTQPLDLNGLNTDTEKARAVLGFPSMKDWPPMTFTAAMPRSAGKVEAERIRNSKYGQPSNGQSEGVADGAITAGLADAAPGAALGAVAVLNTDTSGFHDARITLSHILCFKPAEQLSKEDALKACWDDYDQNVTTAFELIEPRSDSFWRHSYRIKVPVDGRTALITDRYRAQYAPGYAPVEMGGFKAHTFRIEMIIWPDPKSSYKVEDLAQLLGKTKPDSLVYLLSAKGDPREREGLEPIGVF